MLLHLNFTVWVPLEMGDMHVVSDRIWHRVASCTFEAKLIVYQKWLVHIYPTVCFFKNHMELYQCKRLFVSHSHFIEFFSKPGPLLCTHVYAWIYLHCCVQSYVEPRPVIDCCCRSLITVLPCSMPTLCWDIVTRIGEIHISATLACTKLLPPT